MSSYLHRATVTSNIQIVSKLLYLPLISSVSFVVL